MPSNSSLGLKAPARVLFQTSCVIYDYLRPTESGYADEELSSDILPATSSWRSFQSDAPIHLLAGFLISPSGGQLLAAHTHPKT
jgi:hypothetical protein